MEDTGEVYLALDVVVGMQNSLVEGRSQRDAGDGAYSGVISYRLSVISYHISDIRYHRLCLVKWCKFVVPLKRQFYRCYLDSRASSMDFLVK